MELFKEFDSVSYQDWIDQINMDLKGKDFNENLVWESMEGIKVQPFYNSTSSEKKTSFIPLKQHADWKICETIVIRSIEEANKKALMALNGGANSLFFKGTISSKEQMAELLHNVMADIIELNFYNPNPLQTLSFLHELYPSKKMEGSIGYDYLCEYVVSGKWNKETATDELINLTKTSGHLRSVTINGMGYLKKNATIVHELAFALAQGVEYLSILTANGISAQKVAQKIQFHFGIGCNYFFEIAKLRAARKLWELILNQYQVTDVSMFIHSETSGLQSDGEHQHLNMLRATTEAMSAVVGGCDSLTVLPYDVAVSFAERIARNVQHILKEESFLDKVKNPADGSYYIEYLTDELAQKAWHLFQIVESKGGFIACIENNFIKNEIHD